MGSYNFEWPIVRTQHWIVVIERHQREDRTLLVRFEFLVFFERAFSQFNVPWPQRSRQGEA